MSDEDVVLWVDLSRKSEMVFLMTFPHSLADYWKDNQFNVPLFGPPA